MNALRAFLRHNLLYKIGALLIAIVIWNMVNASIITSRQASLPMAHGYVKQVPIKVLDNALEKRVVTIVPTIAGVGVKGPTEEVRRITSEQIMLYVDVSRLQRGQKYKQQIQYSVNAWGVQVESITPREVEVELGP